MGGISRREALLTGWAAAAAPAAAAADEARRGLEPLRRALQANSGTIAARPETAMGAVRRRLLAAAEQGLFEPWLGDARADAGGKVALLKGGDGLRRWKVQLFRIPAGTSHPPHAHENLASCLVVLRGRLQAREFQRHRERETGDWAVLSTAREDELAPGAGMVTTDAFRNVHWFGAGAEPVVAVNFKASGYERFEPWRLANRRYLDLSATRAGPFPAAFLGGDAAHARFGSRPPFAA